jgi:hypothetical protein
MLERRLAGLSRAAYNEGQLLDLQHMILSQANDMQESLEDSEVFASGGEFSDTKPWRVGRKIWRRPAGMWER